MSGHPLPQPRSFAVGFRPPPGPPPRWVFLAMTAGVVAFILYGSYVPFEWQARPWDEVTRAYRWAVAGRVIPDSRSDWAANVALGVPLGFALLGLMRVNRPGGAGDWVAIGPVVAGCTLFAAAVEFGQLYCPGRTCSGSDIWAQGLGALIGSIVWVARGRRLTAWIRSALVQDGVRTSTAPLLAGYAGLVLVVQLLPLDLTASPWVIYKRLRDPGQVTVVPFAELFDRSEAGGTAGDLKKLAAWAELFALFVPAGLLSAGLPGRFRSANGLLPVAGYGLLGAAATEIGQVLVLSRHASTTDAIVGGFGCLTGWAAARILTDGGVKRYRQEAALVIGQVWVALLAFIQWQPFDFHPRLLATRLESIDWMPLGSQVSKNYLWALNEILTKFLLFVPPGAAVVWASVRHHERSRPLIAAAACGAAAVVLELGQALVPSRHVSPTDVLFGVTGGYLGGEVARRVMGVRMRITVQRTVPGYSTAAADVRSLPGGADG